MDEGILLIKVYDKYDRVFYIKSFLIVIMFVLRIGFVVVLRYFVEEVVYYKLMVDILILFLI